MFIRALFTTLLIILHTHYTFAGTRDPNTPDSKYVEFGKQFPSVLRFRATIEITDKKTGEKRPTQQYGSAVVIKPNWVLTAAHMTVGATDHEILRDDGRVHKLPTVFVPKDFDDKMVGWHDLALCHSPDEVKLDFYADLYRETDEIGKTITVAGYGLTGTFHTGCTLSDGKKRAGHNKIDGEMCAVLICTPSTGANRFPLEYMISPGDSGGGMFIGNKLAGVNSFLMAEDKNPNGSYTDESAFTRISLYANWIDSQIAKHEAALLGRATTSAELDMLPRAQ